MTDAAAKDAYSMARSPEYGGMFRQPGAMADAASRDRTYALATSLRKQDNTIHGALGFDLMQRRASSVTGAVQSRWGDQEVYEKFAHRVGKKVLDGAWSRTTRDEISRFVNDITPAMEQRYEKRVADLKGEGSQSAEVDLRNTHALLMNLTNGADYEANVQGKGRVVVPGDYDRAVANPQALEYLLISTTFDDVSMQINAGAHHAKRQYQAMLFEFRKLLGY